VTVTACDIPPESLLRGDAASASFHDSYAIRLARADLDVVAIFAAVFGHLPTWLRLLLHVRNRAAALVGLEAPTVHDINNVHFKPTYRIGEKIGGVWPIFALNERELVAGRDNKHLDFRVSVIRIPDEEGGVRVVVTTVCKVHNLFGTIYLRAIVPFHKYSVQHLIADSVAKGRL
jgi:hypothetical protein